MASSSEPSNELAALRRREIGVRRYLRARLGRVMAPLREKLMPRDLELLVPLIEQLLLTDPALARYIRNLGRPDHGDGTTAPDPPDGVR